MKISNKTMETIGFITCVIGFIVLASEVDIYKIANFSEFMTVAFAQLVIGFGLMYLGYKLIQKSSNDSIAEEEIEA